MTAPTALRSTAGQLVLDWPDGSRSELAHTRLHGRIDLAPSDIRVQAINNQGYGVQLIFSDGHDRGIYPWDYLRGL